jgi:hypothetical protein
MTYSLFENAFFRTTISFNTDFNCSDSVASIFIGENSFKSFPEKKKDNFKQIRFYNRDKSQFTSFGFRPSLQPHKQFLEHLRQFF